MAIQDSQDSNSPVLLQDLVLVDTCTQPLIAS
jgi:hypothetical protein